MSSEAKGKQSHECAKRNRRSNPKISVLFVTSIDDETERAPGISTHHHFAKWFVDAVDEDNMSKQTEL
jgi:hypothetical protein